MVARVSSAMPKVPAAKTADGAHTKAKHHALNHCTWGAHDLFLVRNVCILLSSLKFVVFVIIISGKTDLSYRTSVFVRCNCCKFVYFQK
jgi:hypothetical protein